MTDTAPNSSTTPPLPPDAPNSAAPSAPLPPPRKKKRWWLRILLSLVVLILLLIVFAPFLAGIAPVRSIVVAKVNDQLAGSIAIDDYSVGWTGGVSASGIKVFDDHKNLVIEIPKFETGLSLLAAARGNYDLGNTTADAKINVEVYPDGTTSLDHIAKPADKSEPREKKDPTEPKPAKPSTTSLPNVRGNIKLNIIGGKISGDGLPATVTIDPSTVAINISDINKSIENTIALNYRVGDGAASTINIDGAVSAVQANQLVLDKLKAEESIKLTNVNLAAGTAFAKSALGPDAELGGIASGNLAVSADGLSGLSATGNFFVDNALYHGAGVKDTLKLARISIPIHVTRTVVNATTTQIKIEQLGVNSQLANLNVTGQLQQESLQHLAKNEAPGADGSISIMTTVPDFGALSRALPNTMKLAPGVTISGGSLTNTANITLTADNVMLAQKLDVTASGTRDGKPIQIQPIHLETAGTALPDGKPIPQIKDVKLALTSAFATIDGGGATLAALNVKGNLDFPKLQNEIGQFIDLGKAKMAGTADFAVTTRGDPSGVGPIDASFSANASNVIISGVGPATTTQPIEQPHFAMTANAKLNRDAGGAVATVPSANFALQTGDADKPLVDVKGEATNVDLKTQSVAAFKFSGNLNDLAALQKQFGAFVAALAQQQIQIDSGGAYVNASGSYDGPSKTAKIAGDSSFPNIVVSKAGKQVFGREDITGKIVGTVSLADSGPAGEFSALALSAKSGLFTVAKSDDAPFNFKLATKGGISGNGKLNIAADLKRLSDISQNFASAAAETAKANGVVVTSAAGSLRSGMFNGTLALAHADKPQTDVTFDGALSNLTITTNDKPIENESAKIALIASSPDDLSGVTVSKLSLDSHFATINNPAPIIIKLNSEEGLWGMIQSASLQINAPQLATLDALRRAFSPTVTTTPPNQPAAFAPADHPVMLVMQSDDDPKPEKKKKKKAPAESDAAADKPVVAAVAKNTAPIEIAGGSATMTINVKRDSAAHNTTVDLSDCTIKQLSLRRGTQKYDFQDDVAFKLSAAVNAVNDLKKAVGDQINSITVSTLSGNLGGIAKLSMPDAFNIKGPLGKPAINGSINLAGEITDANAPLLAMLQGVPTCLYRADFVMNEKVSSVNGEDGAAINAGGTIDSKSFKLLDDSGKVAFQDALSMKNDIGAYLDKKSATIRQLDVSLPNTNALAVSVVGRVNNWDTNRQIRDFKLSTKGDLAQLWKILLPMMTPEQQQAYATLTTSGKLDVSFNIPSSSFPAKPTVYESMKYLDANGSISGIELLDLPQGLTIQSMEVPFAIKKGLFGVLAGKVGPRAPTPDESNDAKANGSGLAGLLGGGKKSSAKSNAADSNSSDTAAADATKAATDMKPENGYANTGAVNLAGITVDLTSPNLTTSIPKDKHILNDVRLNPILADTLGKFGAMALVGSDTAKGLVNLKIAECRNVPLADLTARNPHANAVIVLSVDNLQLNGAVIGVLAQVADLGNGGIQGKIPDSTITINNGQATTDLTILVDKEVADADTGKKALQGQAITFKGGMSLANLQLRDFVINFPAELMLKEMRKYAPNGAALPVTGTADHPKIDVQKFIAENAIKSLIPGGKDKNGNDKDGGLGGILDQIGKRKKDKDKE